MAKTKNYKAALEAFPKEPVSAKDAFDALVKAPKMGFDQTVEAHFRL